MSAFSLFSYIRIDLSTIQSIYAFFCTRTALIMTYEPLNRRLAILATVFAALGVILGVIALATNYWTVLSISEPINNATLHAHEQQYHYGRMWNVRPTIVLSARITSII